MIYDLDYNEITHVQSGEEYMVPCVRGLPVVLPSHVDTGDAGSTGRHWHADNRFPTAIAREEFDKRSNDYFDNRFAHGLRFTEAGGPRYMPPFFLHVGPLSVPARTGDNIEFKYPKGMKETIVRYIELRDSEGEHVTKCELAHLVVATSSRFKQALRVVSMSSPWFVARDKGVRICGGDTLKVNLGPSWNPEEFCPSFRKTG